MNEQRGFTLIELMIVIAILGILLAIAMPVYNDYTVRAKVAEGIMAMAPIKLAIAEYRLSESTWPTDNATAGLPATIAGEFVSSMVVTSNVITLTFANIDPAVNGETLTMSGALVGGEAVFEWTCGGAGTSVATSFLPAECR